MKIRQKDLEQDIYLKSKQKSGLLLLLMKLKFIFRFMSNIFPSNVSNHRKFYQNLFINESSNDYIAKILMLHSPKEILY